MQFCETYLSIVMIYIIYICDKKEIHYYDSMSGSGQKYLDGLRKWVVDESSTRKNMTVETQKWKLIDNERHVPQQTNCNDCGVFATICADFISDDLPLSYGKAQMLHYRKKIGTDIIRGSLLYPMETMRTDK